MLRATLFAGQCSVTICGAYDRPGKILLTGPEHFQDVLADWLHTAVGYPTATPRDLHAALLANIDRWRVSEIEVDDATPPGLMPEGRSLRGSPSP